MMSPWLLWERPEVMTWLHCPEQTLMGKTILFLPGQVMTP
jgi:hypothetical protein